MSIDAYRSPAGRICGVYPLFTPPACIAAVATNQQRRAVEAGASDPRAEPTGQAATPGRSADETAEGVAKDGGAALGGAAGPATGVEASGQGGGGGDAGGGTGHPDIPPVLVVNCQLPDIPTPFSGQGDGPTVHIIFTFRATSRLCRYAAQVWADETNAVASGGEQAAAAAAATVGAAAGGSEGTFSRAQSGGSAAAAASGASSDAAASGGSLPRGGREGATVAGGHASGIAGSADDGGEGEDGEVPESVRLLVEWMRRAEDDGNFRGRFKAIGDIVNADEASFAPWLSAFVFARTTARFYGVCVLFHTFRVSCFTTLFTFVVP